MNDTPLWQGDGVRYRRSRADRDRDDGRLTKSTNGWYQCQDRSVANVKAGARAMADEQSGDAAPAQRLEEYQVHSIRRTRFLGDLWAARVRIGV